jgi:hypothetical protein
MIENIPAQEIEIDTDTGDILNIYNAGSTTVIEIWSELDFIPKEEIRLTKSQSSLLIKALQEMK